MSEENPMHEAISQAECVRLLAGMSVGRLALHVGALPTVAVVDACFTEDGTVVRSIPEPWFDVATDGAVVAFEAGGADPDTAGRWSVVVVGKAEALDDRFVRVSLTIVTGHRQVADPMHGTGLRPVA